MFFKVTVFVLILVALSPNVYAQQSTDQCGTTKFDCYQETGFRLTKNPVICMGVADNPDKTEMMQRFTTGAFNDWKNTLNELLSFDRWGIYLMSTSTSADCNITIDYFAQPSPSTDANATDGELGITLLNPITHTAQIHIFYNNAGIYDLQYVMRHELGHAFGLGHYMMSDTQVQAYLRGYSVAPSIMLPARYEELHPLKITENDLTQIESLYNNDRFGVNVQQITISTDKQVYHFGDYMTMTINVSQVTGRNATVTLVTNESKYAFTLPISQLQTNITSPFALNQTNSPLGTVKTILSYDGQSVSTSFQIMGNSPSVSSPEAIPEFSTVVGLVIVISIIGVITLTRFGKII